jgi:hypothetical protein
MHMLPGRGVNVINLRIHKKEIIKILYAHSVHPDLKFWA